MPTENPRTFRRFTRAVLELQMALLKHGDAVNAPFGQSSARWRMMYRLSIGEHSVPVIARATGYSRQAVQRLADALVAEGSARYAPDATDRRTQRLEFTSAGKRTLDELEANFDVWSTRLIADLPGEELSALAESLEHVKHVIQADTDALDDSATSASEDARSQSGGTRSDSPWN